MMGCGSGDWIVIRGWLRRLRGKERGNGKRCFSAGRVGWEVGWRCEGNGAANNYNSTK